MIGIGPAIVTGGVLGAAEALWLRGTPLLAVRTMRDVPGPK
ncbi:hypothetical protein [Flexivirga aerilata]|nr:hypothetical protein [Flexivirga aerilata]